MDAHTTQDHQLDHQVARILELLQAAAQTLRARADRASAAALEQAPGMARDRAAQAAMEAEARAGVALVLAELVGREAARSPA